LAQNGAQAAELDAEPRPVRLIGHAGVEGALNKKGARDIGRPRRGESTNECEQDGTSGERDIASRTANRTPAAIDDEVAGGEQGLDFTQADWPDHTGSNESSRRGRQGTLGPANFGDQSRDAGGDGGSMSAVERECGLRDSDVAEREFSTSKLGPGGERRRHVGGDKINCGQSFLGGLKLTDKELAACPDEAGVERIGAVTERVEHLGGGIEPVHRPCQIARGKRDLRLGHLATGPGQSFASSEAARGAAQELARPLVVAELSHRNAAQGERRRVVAQRDALERSERIPGR
jgi:hypothetical protein